MNEWGAMKLPVNSMRYNPASICANEQKATQMMVSPIARNGRPSAMACLAVLFCLLTPAHGVANRQEPATATPLSLKCEPSALQAPWTGADTVTCQVSTAGATQPDVALACEDIPAGLTCKPNPPAVPPSSGTAVIATLSVNYAETLAPGRTSFRIVARQGASQAAHAVTVVKDINTVFARCPSVDEIRAIDRDLRLEFDSDPTKDVASAERCTENAGSRNLTVMQARVYRALSTLRRLTFREPLPWTRDPVYRWFTRTVRGVRFRADITNSSCCGPDRLINVAARVQTVNGRVQSGFALAVTDPTSRMPTDFRMLAGFLQLLVHEARHRDGKPHTCGTKDQTIAEMGAWGAAWAFYRWMAEQTAPGLVPPEIQAQLLQTAANICSVSICRGPCSLR